MSAQQPKEQYCKRCHSKKCVQKFTRRNNIYATCNRCAAKRSKGKKKPEYVSDGEEEDEDQVVPAAGGEGADAAGSGSGKLRNRAAVSAQKKIQAKANKPSKEKGAAWSEEDLRMLYRLAQDEKLSWAEMTKTHLPGRKKKAVIAAHWRMKEKANRSKAKKAALISKGVQALSAAQEAKLQTLRDGDETVRWFDVLAEIGGQGVDVSAWREVIGLFFGGVGKSLEGPKAPRKKKKQKLPPPAALSKDHTALFYTLPRAQTATFPDLDESVEFGALAKTLTDWRAGRELRSGRGTMMPLGSVMAVSMGDCFARTQSRDVHKFRHTHGYARGDLVLYAADAAAPWEPEMSKEWCALGAEQRWKLCGPCFSWMWKDGGMPVIPIFVLFAEKVAKVGTLPPAKTDTPQPQGSEERSDVEGKEKDGSAEVVEEGNEAGSPESMDSQAEDEEPRSEGEEGDPADGADPLQSTATQAQSVKNSDTHPLTTKGANEAAYTAHFKGLHRFQSSIGGSETAVLPVLLVCLPHEVVVTDLSDLEACKDTKTTGGQCEFENKGGMMGGTWTFAPDSSAYLEWAKGKTLFMDDQLPVGIAGRMRELYQEPNHRMSWGEVFDILFAGC